VYVTHLVEEIQRLADRVVILRAGRVETEGTVDEVLGPRPLGEEPAPQQDARSRGAADAGSSWRGGRR
jgi:ABC-type molybdate transport system ATPase subunit